MSQGLFEFGGELRRGNGGLGARFLGGGVAVQGAQQALHFGGASVCAKEVARFARVVAQVEERVGGGGQAQGRGQSVAAGGAGELQLAVAVKGRVVDELVVA